MNKVPHTVINCDGCETIMYTGPINKAMVLNVKDDWVICGELFRPKKFLEIDGKVLFDVDTGGKMIDNDVFINYS